MLNVTKIPKGDKNVNIKILLKEITHKIIGNKAEYEFIIVNLGTNKRKH